MQLKERDVGYYNGSLLAAAAETGKELIEVQRSLILLLEIVSTWRSAVMERWTARRLDEIDCNVLNMNQGAYNKDISPPTLGGQGLLDIDVSFIMDTILKVDEIDEVGGT